MLFRSMPHLDRLKIPLTFLHGARNKLFLPEGSSHSLDVLSAANGPENYKRIEFPTYAHMDLFIGRDAAKDVFPLIANELDAFNPSAREGRQ